MTGEIKPVNPNYKPKFKVTDKDRAARAAIKRVPSEDWEMLKRDAKDPVRMADDLQILQEGFAEDGKFPMDEWPEYLLNYAAELARNRRR